MPVMANGLGGGVSLESPEDSEEGGGSGVEGSAKADSDSGSLWVCGI